MESLTETEKNTKEKVDELNVKFAEYDPWEDYLYGTASNRDCMKDNLIIENDVTSQNEALKMLENFKQ